MNLTSHRHSATDCREPRRARRRARAFEAFMGAQALHLHRTVAAAGRTVLTSSLPLQRDPVAEAGPVG